MWQDCPEPGGRFFLWQESLAPDASLGKTYNFLLFCFSLSFSVSRSPFLFPPFSALSFSLSCFFLLLFPLFRFRLPVFFLLFSLFRFSLSLSFSFFGSSVFAFLLPFLSFFLFVSVFSFVIFVSYYFSELVFILFLHCSSPFLPLFLSFVIGKRRAAKNGRDGQKKKKRRAAKNGSAGQKKRKRRAAKKEATGSENGNDGQKTVKKSDVKKFFPCYKM